MESYIFTQLRFVREQTLKAVNDVSDEKSVVVPRGSNNNIKWNLGHMYVTLERFAFQYIGETMHVPDHFMELFKTGSKPAEWGDLTLPSMSELIGLLEEQTERVIRLLTPRLREAVEPPYTTSTGITLASVEQFLTFNLYHEGMHFDAIKAIKRLIEIK
jgi:hypothetical protein